MVVKNSGNLYGDCCVPSLRVCFDFLKDSVKPSCPSTWSLFSFLLRHFLPSSRLHSSDFSRLVILYSSTRGNVFLEPLRSCCFFMQCFL